MMQTLDSVGDSRPSVWGGTVGENTEVRRNTSEERKLVRFQGRNFKMRQIVVGRGISI